MKGINELSEFCRSLFNSLINLKRGNDIVYGKYSVMRFSYFIY